MNLLLFGSSGGGASCFACPVQLGISFASDLSDSLRLTLQKENDMSEIAMLAPLAAAGYSLVYLLAGGGLFGAVVIFIIAKMLGK